MAKRDWGATCSVILMNEVKPRADKLGMALTEFLEPKLCSALARAEYEGMITRRELRAVLDQRVERLNDKRSR